MQLRNHFVLPVIAVLGLSFLVGCGSSSNKATPPPTGGFSNSNLNGTYVFSTLGTDPSGAPITIAGAFTACGCSQGTISGGTFSLVDPNVALISAQPFSRGSYVVTADGRGQAHLVTGTSVGTMTLDFVLSSSSGGSVTEYDGNGTGSGALELQGTVGQSDLAGSYAFAVSGTGVSGLIASAGAFTLSATGSLTSGIYDVTSLNSTSGVATSQVGVALSTSSTVLVGSGTTPGTADIVDANTNSYTFAVYPISASHLKLIETDGTNLSVGDAFTQLTSLPSGTLAFTMGGVDTGALPLALGGLLPTSGGIISGGVEDFNDGGSVASTSAVSGTLGSLSGGRSVLTLGGFENGATNGTLSNYTFAAYPSNGGTLLLEIDGLGITGGTAVVQSNTAFAASQGYGADLSAVNISSSPFFEEDDIAEFTATTSTLSGLIDINDEGTTSFDQKFSGSFQSASTGRYTLSSNDFNGVFYTVDGSTMLFVETDSNQVGTGSIQIQNGTASSLRALSRLSSAIPKLALHVSAKRRTRPN